MKTAEDEAFEDIERRQGGGFKAKQAMAANKLLEPVECLDCGSNNVGIPATYDSLVDSVKSQPAQEPVAWISPKGNIHFYPYPHRDSMPLYTAPPKRPWVGLTDEETSGFTSQEMTVVKYVSKVLQEKNT